MRIFSFILFMIVGPGLAFAQSSDKPLDEFDEYVAKAVADWGAPGLAIAVVKDDQVAFARGFGVLELGRSDMVDADSLFHVGSTTKAFVSMSLGMLVEEGLIGWNDRVIDHLPDFRVADPYVTRELRITDLLDHGSGVMTGDLLWFSGASRAESMKRLAHAEQAFSLRNNWQYNNMMYLVAGELVAAVTGAPFEDFVRARIFEPLGMSRSVLTEADWDRQANKSVAHYPHPETGEMTVIEYPHIYEAGGAGLINSSVNDYTHWLRFLLRGGELEGQQLVSTATIDEMWRQHNSISAPPYPAAQLANSQMFGYGLGWFVQDYRGEKMVMHTGSIFGQAAIVGLLPEHDLGVVVFINGDHVEIRHALMYEVFDRYLGYDEDMDWSTELKAMFDDIAAESKGNTKDDDDQAPEMSLPLASYAGTYEHPYFGKMTVSMEDDSLILRIGTRLEYKMKHSQYDMFGLETEKFWLGGGSVAFESDNRGGLSAANIYGITFDKVESADPTKG